MELLYSAFFAAGVAGFVYSKMGRRIGYENGQRVWTLVGIVFVMSTIIFMTILSMLDSN